MTNETELKQFYELLLAKLPKEAVSILRIAFLSIREGKIVKEGYLVNETGTESKTVQSAVENLAQRQMIVCSHFTYYQSQK